MFHAYQPVFRAPVTLAAAIACTVLTSSMAADEFVLEEPLVIEAGRFSKIAVSGDGQEVLVCWRFVREIDYQVSHDGGERWEPARIAAASAPNREHVFFDFESSTSPVVSRDGALAAIAAVERMSTDLFSPILPPLLDANALNVYPSDNTDRGFGPPFRLAGMSNMTVPSASIRDIDITCSDDSRVTLAAWDQFHFDDGNLGETFFARRGPKEWRLVNLSNLVAPNRRDSASNPSIASDFQGENIFVAWSEDGTPDEGGIVARSGDGGRTWESLPGFETAYAFDLGYARDTDRLAVVASDGGFPQPTRIEVWTSDDRGDSFLSQVVVEGAVNPIGSPEIIVSAASVAVSADGSVIAVLYAEEICDPIFGCSFDADVVLTVSEDGGGTFDRVGVVASTFFSRPYDLAISDDGNVIYVVSDAAEYGQTVFARAFR